MSWPAFVCTAVGFAVLGCLLILLIAFAADEVIYGDDPDWEDNQ